jgi:DNA-binding transcriptional LysR family regulator
MNSATPFWPPPIDLYGLGLLRLISDHQNFTRAAAAAGLTQSALTRQLQGMEARLGVILFERTTRAVHLTPAGETLLRETGTVSRIMDAALRSLGQKHLNAPREIHLGVSRSLALAHFPGLLHAHLRQSDSVKVIVEHLAGTEIISRMESGDLDVAVLCPPRRLPAGIIVTHRMEDVFHLIVPADATAPTMTLSKGRWPARLTSWLGTLPWILPKSGGQTGHRTRRWLEQHGVVAKESMELDDFDLMLQLVSLKMGIALVPRRALAGFHRRHLVKRIPLPEEFQRELAVILPRLTRTPEHVSNFVENILFS